MATRIPFDSLCVQAATHEIARTLQGGLVQSITQPAPLQLVLGIYAGGRRRYLLLSADATWARLHETWVKRPNPPEPPVFCMACRKHLDGATLAAVQQPEFDRVVTLRFSRAGTAAGDLVVEMMGKHANIILVDPDGRILDSMKHISARLSRTREVLPGRPYVMAPIAAGTVDPRLDGAQRSLAEAAALPDTEAAAARAMATLQGLSPFLAQELLARCAEESVEQAWRSVFGAPAGHGFMVRDAAGVALGAYPVEPVCLPGVAAHAMGTFSLAADAAYTELETHAHVANLSRQAEGQMQRALKSRQSSMTELTQQARKLGSAETHQRRGELLLAHQSVIAAGSAEARVADLFEADMPEVAITLDPDMTIPENAERLFAKARKARSGAARLAEYRERLEAEIATLSAALQSLRNDPEADPGTLCADLREAGLLAPEPGPAPVSVAAKKAAEPHGGRISTVRTVDGYEILIGLSAEANDHLTTRVAAPTDWWLHVRGGTGAHVVVRSKGHPEAVPAAVLQEAAVWAARNSASKHSSVVAVDVTQKKHVRRPRGGAPGLVTYRNERTLHVDPKREG
ncbi:MAG: NFACT RNA binding domain-containing protein [Armatimonadetes bacterium]|nr:NFACT RNA binding domain-containing protein [Armatimonadota bacterium]